MYIVALLLETLL